MGLMNLSIDRSFACQFCETRVGHGTTAHFFGMKFSLKVIVSGARVLRYDNIL